MPADKPKKLASAKARESLMKANKEAKVTKVPHQIKSESVDAKVDMSKGCLCHVAGAFCPRHRKMVIR